jgi:hypothetical protein
MSTLALPSGTRDLSATVFIEGMEQALLSRDRFRHYDHVRLAWLYLERAPLDEAIDRIRATIRRFTVHHLGSDARYHDTITCSFMHLVAAARSSAPAGEDFDGFAERNARLFETSVLERHYSRELLGSPRARASWVAPDREPLPEIANA